MVALDPVALQLGEHALQVRHRKGQHLVGAHRVQGLGVRQVLREVDDVAAAIGFCTLEVGVLDDAHEREVGVVDVEPVGVGQRAVQLQHQAHIGQIVDAFQLCDVGRLGPAAHHVGHQRQRRCHHHMVGHQAAARVLHAPAAAFGRDGADRGTGQGLPAQRMHAGLQRGGQGLEAAAEVGQALLAALAAAAAPQLELVPEPHRRDLVGHGAELALQQRLPHHLVDAFTAQLAQPLGRGLALQRHPVVDAARTQRQQAQADAVEKAQRREVQQVPGRGQLEEVVGVVNAGVGRVDGHLRREAQLVDQRHHLAVVGEPVVVETVEPLAADVEGGGQAGNVRCSFQHRDMDALLGEFIGRGQAAEAATHHGNRGLLFVHQVTCSFGSRPSGGRSMKYRPPASVGGSHSTRWIRKAKAAAAVRSLPANTMAWAVK